MVAIVTLDFAQPDEAAQALAARLRNQRLSQNLTQQELAARAGVALGTVKQLERSGRCSFASWLRVVFALGLAAELEPLFVTQPRSIAQMERAAAPPRQRARKRRFKPSATGVPR